MLILYIYSYNIHGPKAYEAIKNRIKEEVENCIDFDSFLIIQSLAGGTGSGLGQYYEKKILIIIIIIYK